MNIVGVGCSGCQWQKNTNVCAQCKGVLAFKPDKAILTPVTSPKSPKNMANCEAHRQIRTGGVVTYRINPVSKPRQTRSDKWKQRKCVMKYRAFADKCRELGVALNESGDHIIFIVPMPEGWSKKKKQEMAGKPHQQRPDTDNFLKAVQDAIMFEDAVIWDIRISKRWGYIGRIEIRPGTNENAGG